MTSRKTFRKPSRTTPERLPERLLTSYQKRDDAGSWHLRHDASAAWPSVPRHEGHERHERHKGHEGHEGHEHIYLYIY